ncbi:hypothetical protein K504DRAFT_499649 [Pleomassaria siparia CBS 279.74]|uniref:Uncharacterized protein n=1 Tax=Pleomassaria siparia CBS 279.74 TaxID=1314801 RepID=A0A6G1KIA7_9PLEO|nr:hypothetical protein K504DRAFT_499649 [Pleomassaria siparia CBS 279.74]
MRFFVAAVLAAELGSSLARPTQVVSDLSSPSGLENTAFSKRDVDIAAILQSIGIGSTGQPDVKAGGKDDAAVQNKAALKNEEAPKASEAALKAKEGAAVQGEAAAKEGKATAKEGEAAAKEGEAAEGEGNEKNLVGVFDVVTELEGGDIKQDVQFTKSAVGSFEFEFQGAAADQLTVTENKTPAAPPAGFVAIEPSSFKVALAQSKGVGLTLSKIDYIFDTASTATTGVDLTKAKVGKLCTDVGAFVIEETLGEVEFEADENEVTLNLNKAVVAEGEWGIFVPAAAVTGAFTATLKAASGGAAAGNSTVKAPAAADGKAAKVKGEATKKAKAGKMMAMA